MVYEARPKKAFYKRLPAWAQRLRARMPRWLFPATLFFIGMVVGGFGVSIIVERRRAAADLVVVVRGIPITAQAFYHRMETQIGSATLKQMVAEELTLQYAHEKHIALPDSQVQARAKQLMQQPGFQAAMKQSKGTQDDVERMARVQIAKEALYGKDITVSDAEVKEFYRIQSDPKNPRALFFIPEGARINIIATSSEETIRKAYTEIMKGKLFSEAAKTYSALKSRLAGGDEHFVARGRSIFSQMPDIEKALFALKPGELMPPRFGGKIWFLITCLDRTPARTIPFAEVREQCEREVRIGKGKKANLPQVEAEFTDFSRKAPIQIFWDQYHYDLKW